MQIEDDFNHAYNGISEVMQRQLIILSSFQGMPLNFHELTLLDFFVQHGGDVGMPISLHYPNVNRWMAYEVRIPMIQSALELLTGCGIIYTDTDHAYRIGKELALSADDFTSGYLKGLRFSAEYLAANFAEDRNSAVEHLSARLKELKSPVAELSSNQREQFAYLQSQYSFDYQRMIGLQESIVFQRRLFDSDAIAQADLSPTPAMFDTLEAAVRKELASIPAKYHDLSDLIVTLDGLQEPHVISSVEN